MNLPPPPKELAAFAETQARHCALNDMVQAYGQQCRAAGLEDAADICGKEGHLWLGAPAHAFFELAEQIRSLK